MTSVVWLFVLSMLIFLPPTTHAQAITHSQRLALRSVLCPTPSRGMGGRGGANKAVVFLLFLALTTHQRGSAGDVLPCL